MIFLKSIQEERKRTLGTSRVTYNDIMTHRTSQ